MAKKRQSNTSLVKHSKSGFYSCACATVILLVVVSSLLYAKFTYGQMAGGIGGVLLLCVFLSIKGIRLGLRGRKERNCNHLNCIVGIICNALLGLFILLLFLNGLRWV